ncbi:hypothetical protein [Sinorhizobium sp. CCBAU 05631]|uniref:hypothetical protein n=1 Tax=Sinorhizobium sp. CCBAU 05631 TaxID=794846 RepID=UPI00055A065D|nr:hypothetical protein [Sinorhizobium sp. CCBAU 05631]
MAMKYWLVAALLVYSANAYSQEVKEEDLVVDWPAAKAAAAEDLRTDKTGIDKFRAASPGNLDAVGVPVLVTGTGPVRAAPRLKAQDKSYAAVYPLDGGATLSIMGTARGVALTGEANAPGELPDYQSGQFSMLDDDSEEGSPPKTREADFSFVKFGAAYTLRLTCTVEGDERCLKEDFAQSVAESLVQVGGAPQ